MTSWIKQHTNPHARLRLFCFPYAGGAASIYRTWPQHLPTDIEVYAVQLPGRENRIREQPFTDIRELVAALLPNLRAYLDKPFTLFGHSMGSVIAYELALQLQQQGQAPTHLFVSGRRAPFLPDREPPLHLLTDDAFLHELQRRYNNLPAIIFQDAELRELFLPLLRADLTLVETYQPLDKVTLSCPIVAFGGIEDARASTAELNAWQELTTADFALHLLPGGHFFINEQTAPLLTLITDSLSY